MSDFGFREHDKAHARVSADQPGLCPVCLERYITGTGGAQTPLIEEVVDGVKRWTCPLGGDSYADQVKASGLNRSGWRFGVSPR